MADHCLKCDYWVIITAVGNRCQCWPNEPTIAPKISTNVIQRDYISIVNSPMIPIMIYDIISITLLWLTIRSFIL